MSGQSGTLAVTVSTLLVAAAFQPLRTRIQRAVDHRFYRAATTRPHAGRVQRQAARAGGHRDGVGRGGGRRCRASAGSPGRGRRPGRWYVLTSSRAASSEAPSSPHATAQPDPSRPPVTVQARTLLHPRHRDDVGSRDPLRAVNTSPRRPVPRPAGSICAARLQCARRDPSPPRPRAVRAPRLPPVRRGARGARRPARRSRGARPRRPRASSSATSRPTTTGSAGTRSRSRSSRSASARLELATSPARLRRLLADVLDGAPGAPA